ncbi:MAG: DUF423 domain-containing protein [Nitrospinae bacterium]|nr:DUF423 domain-containing protein [Nitrospinota bacterium]
MRIWIQLGGLFGGLSVLLGAFGAHSLKDHLTQQKLDVFQTATQYQFFHSLALVLVGILALQAGEQDRKKINRAGKFFTAGILLFSGSLYILAFDGPRFFGPITPIGGLSLIIGWSLLAFSISKK